MGIINWLFDWGDGLIDWHYLLKIGIYIAAIISFLSLISCQTRPVTDVTAVTAVTNVTNESFKIASFNLQIFGDSKVNEQEAFEILTIVACEFDILAVQEIRDIDGSSIIEYVENINNVCEDEYSYSMSPRLGRSSSKENYAFIYRTKKVRLFRNEVYPDIDDLFEREPFIGEFAVGNYSFIVSNIHIKPSDAEREMAFQYDVYNYILNKYQNRNIIFLGDMNADCSYYDVDKPNQMDMFVWIVDDEEDTTTGKTDCAYDRIIITDEANKHYTGNWNTFRFDEIVEVSDVSQVSDHYPVWIEMK